MSMQALLDNEETDIVLIPGMGVFDGDLVTGFFAYSTDAVRVVTKVAAAEDMPLHWDTDPGWPPNVVAAGAVALWPEHLVELKAKLTRAGLRVQVLLPASPPLWTH
jgi:hypothetical protein